MREKERRKEERSRIAKEREEKLERLMKGRDPRDEMDQSSSVDAAGGRVRAPAAHEEFAAVLRMRLTDARHALERSTKLARATRNYRGGWKKSCEVDHSNPLNCLAVVMGLATWFYQALLPQLVPLPVPSAVTSELLQSGEATVLAATATRAKGMKLSRDAEKLAKERRQRPPKGFMSPAERALEVQERHVSWFSVLCSSLSRPDAREVEKDHRSFSYRALTGLLSFSCH